MIDYLLFRMILNKENKIILFGYVDDFSYLYVSKMFHGEL